MENIQSEDPEDPCICVWVNSVPREGYNIQPVLHVHSVLPPLEIIGRVVDVHAVPLFKSIFRNIELVAVLRSECGWLGVILIVENAGKEVILELHNEVLEEC